MKVFELMNHLSKLPSGAEIQFRTIMNLEEFAELPKDSEDHIVSLSIEEVEELNDGLVAIYH